MRKSILFSVLLLSLFSGVVSGDNGGKKIVLEWDTPETGTAVSYDNEAEYKTQPPVLLSRPTGAHVKTEVNMAPSLTRLILPGMEDVPGEPDTSPEENTDDTQGDFGLRAARIAREFFEKKVKTVNVNGVTLNIERDCSFFVRAVYWEASGHSVDLFREAISARTVPDPATGVTIISEFFRKKHRYVPAKPKPGDVIVFDNTYDKNNNQKRDDFYTHVGVVYQVRPDGTIEFYHGNISRTIKKGYINFNYKNQATNGDQPVNSYIRPRYSWEAGSNTSLASHLVRSFAGF